MIKILLVEDDQNLGYILKEYLHMHEFHVEWARDGEEGLSVFEKRSFDICILDVMMPKLDGFGLASSIRKMDPSVPLIFLTAKSLKIDKLKGFKTGCDDYIVKPVDEEELIARIKAVLRRSSYEFAPGQSQYQLGPIDFQVSNQQLILGEEHVHLTQKETRLLEMLCSAKGELVKSDKILKDLWGENTYFTRRSMDVFISKLRKHLVLDDRVKIRNIHGSGYVLEIAEDQ